MNQPHHGVFTRLVPSTVHGVGVAAILPIKRGQRIFGPEGNLSRWVQKEKVATLPKAVRALYRDYCLLVGDFYGCARPSFNLLTPACFINHSATNPNVGCNSCHEFYALRNIAPNEELLVDYRSYSRLYDEKLVFQFQTEKPRKGGKMHKQNTVPPRKPAPRPIGPGGK